MRTFKDRFRVWLADHDPFLRVTQVAVYVLIGGAFAVYVGWQQTRIADQQTQLAEHQLAVSREQLKVAAAQAEIARAALIPRFDFIPSGSFPPNVRVLCNRSDIHDLTCAGTLFVERRQLDGVKRVQIADFFAPIVRGEDGLTWTCFIDDAKNRAALLDFQYSPDDKRGAIDLLAAFNFSYRDSKAYSVHSYFEMRYYNAAKEAITDRYVTVYPGWRPRPVVSEPEYVGTIKFADFQKSEGGYDFQSLYAAIDKVIGPPPTFTVSASGHNDE